MLVVLIVAWAWLWPFTLLCRRAASDAFYDAMLAGRTADPSATRVAAATPLVLVLGSFVVSVPVAVIGFGTAVWLCGFALAGGTTRRWLPVAVAVPTICAPLAWASMFYDFMAPAPDLVAVIRAILIVTFVAPAVWCIFRPIRIDPRSLVQLESQRANS